MLIDTNFKAAWSSFSGCLKLCFVRATEQSSGDDNDGLLLTLICEQPLIYLKPSDQSIARKTALKIDAL